MSLLSPQIPSCIYYKGFFPLRTVSSAVSPKGKVLCFLWKRAGRRMVSSLRFHNFGPWPVCCFPHPGRTGNLWIPFYDRVNKELGWSFSISPSERLQISEGWLSLTWKVLSVNPIGFLKLRWNPSHTIKLGRDHTDSSSGKSGLFRSWTLSFYILQEMPFLQMLAHNPYHVTLVIDIYVSGEPGLPAYPLTPCGPRGSSDVSQGTVFYHACTCCWTCL